MSDGPELSDEQVEFLNTVFDLVRAGDAVTVADYVDCGVPVDLTNANGDTLLLLAAYHEHPDLVRALLDRKADPNPGERPWPDRLGGRGVPPEPGDR